LRSPDSSPFGVGERPGRPVRRTLSPAGPRGHDLASEVDGRPCVAVLGPAEEAATTRASAETRASAWKALGVSLIGRPPFPAAWTRDRIAARIGSASVAQAMMTESRSGSTASRRVADRVSVWGQAAACAGGTWRDGGAGDEKCDTPETPRAEGFGRVLSVSVGSERRGGDSIQSPSATFAVARCYAATPRGSPT
jgi:hypothetical protein